MLFIANCVQGQIHGKIISSLKTDQNDALVPEVIILATLQKAELTSIFVSGL